MNTDSDPPPESLFRPAKRRKFIPRRPDNRTEDSDPARNSATASSANSPRSPRASSGDGVEDDHPTGVVRLRRPHATRKGGIAFSATPRSSKEGQQTALVSAEDDEQTRVQAMCDRFTSDINQTEDVDKHMFEALPFRSLRIQVSTNKIRMAYIDLEMAKRFQRNAPTNPSALDSSTAAQTTRTTITGQQEREPASLGKLHEIDLGQEAKLRNIARTEAATRRLAGDEDSNNPDETNTTQPQRPTGEKSWRKSKRRTSADIERDRLVEEVMRESKCEFPFSTRVSLLPGAY